MTLKTVPIDLVNTGDRLRGLDENHVAALMDSIREVGLLNPVTVYPRRVIRDHNSVDGYGLVAGMHRMTACARLGQTEIAANIVTLGDLHRQLAECDENLCGTKLTTAERTLFTKRRKLAYEGIHGPAKARGAAAANRAMGRDASANLADAFTTDTAKKTGASERSVQRDAERGDRIADEALEAIKGTPLDSGAYLDQLKSVPEEKQVEQIKADLVKPRAKRERPETPEDKLRQKIADLKDTNSSLRSLLETERETNRRHRDTIETLRYELTAARGDEGEEGEDGELGWHDLLLVHYFKGARDLQNRTDEDQWGHRRAAFEALPKPTALEAIEIMEDAGARAWLKIYERMVFDSLPRSESKPEPEVKKRGKRRG